MAEPNAAQSSQDGRWCGLRGDGPEYRAASNGKSAAIYAMSTAKRETDLANRYRDQPKRRYLLDDVCLLLGSVPVRVPVGCHSLVPIACDLSRHSQTWAGSGRGQ